MTVNSSQLANNYNPQFSKIFQDAVEKVEPQFDKIFQVLTSKQQYEKMGAMTGTGLLMQKLEGMGATELKVYNKVSKTFTHNYYSGYVRITEEAADDDLSGELKKMPELLGIAARQTVETQAASIFDLSQTTAGPDGKALLATDHPLYGAIGTTVGNRPTANAALSVTSMEAALAAMRQTVDDYNNPKPLFPKTLLINATNEFMSTQLLKNLEKSGVTTRDTNAIRERGMTVRIWDYMTLSGAWYLMCDPSETELIYYWRKKITGQMKAAPDTTNDAIFQSSFRNSMGWIDWRGIYGSYNG